MIEPVTMQFVSIYAMTKKKWLILFSYSPNMTHLQGDMPDVGGENAHFKSISISSRNQVRILGQEEFNDSFFPVKVI